METLMHLGKSSNATKNCLYFNNSESGADHHQDFSNYSAGSSPLPLHNPRFFSSTNSDSSIGFLGNPVEESTAAPHLVVPSCINVAPIFTAAAINQELLFANSLQKGSSSMDAMREMIFRIAMMQPIQIDPESVKPPKRKNVKISKDPQSVAARHRRERISEKIRILQRLVPGGTKMDTASMLDEAAHYLKFLKKQVRSLEQTTAAAAAAANNTPIHHGPQDHHHLNIGAAAGIPMTMATSSSLNHSNLAKSCQHQHVNMVGSMQMLSFQS